MRQLLDGGFKKKKPNPKQKLTKKKDQNQHSNRKCLPTLTLREQRMKCKNYPYYKNKSKKKSVRSQTFSDDHYLEIVGQKPNLEQKSHEKAKTQQSLYKATTEEQHKQ